MLTKILRKLGFYRFLTAWEAAGDPAFVQLLQAYKQRQAAALAAARAEFFASFPPGAAHYSPPGEEITEENSTNY